MAEKKKRNRSPLYPFINLKVATEHCITLYNEASFYFVPYDQAIEYLGHSSTSSHGLRTLGALNHFGLIEEKGSKEERQVRLSQLGKRIVLGQELDASDYREAIKEAALTPKVYKHLWEKYSEHGIPTDNVIQHHLIIDLDFNPKAVDSFIKDFRATLEFAKLTENGVSSENDTDRESGDDTGTEAAPDELEVQREDVSGSDFGLFSSSPLLDEDSSTPPREQREQAPHTRTVDFPFILADGTPRAILRVQLPLSKDDFDLLELGLDYQLKVLAKSLGVDRGNNRES